MASQSVCDVTDRDVDRILYAEGITSPSPGSGLVSLSELGRHPGERIYLVSPLSVLRRRCRRKTLRGEGGCFGSNSQRGADARGTRVD